MLSWHCHNYHHQNHLSNWSHRQNPLDVECNVCDALVAAFLLRPTSVQSDECDWGLFHKRPQQMDHDSSFNKVSPMRYLNLPTESFKWEFIHSVIDCTQAAPCSKMGCMWAKGQGGKVGATAYIGTTLQNVPRPAQTHPFTRPWSAWIHPVTLPRLSPKSAEVLGASQLCPLVVSMPYGVSVTPFVGAISPQLKVAKFVRSDLKVVRLTEGSSCMATATSCLGRCTSE